MTVGPQVAIFNLLIDFDQDVCGCSCCVLGERMISFSKTICRSGVRLFALGFAANGA
jgi:hypothetical protein